MMLLRGLAYSLFGGLCGLVTAILALLVLSLFWGIAGRMMSDVLLFGVFFGAASFPIIGLLWDDGDWFWKK